MPWSNVNLVLNVRDRTSGSYQAALFNAENQNIVQGQIHSLSVNEVNFPYDIPNVSTGFNVFELYTVAPADPYVLTIVVPPGFYLGPELATEITTLIAAEGAADDPPLAPGDVPTCVYDATSNRFTFVTPTNVAFDQSWVLASPYTFPFNYVGVATPALGKDILSIMGFKNTGTGQIGNVGGNEVAQGGSAPLIFTQYIDICSPQLCKFQEFQGGSTTNLARRGDVICRLYIANNIAVQEAEGQRPTVINRQFYNSRVMKWTTGNSIGTIDIQLYDDVGQVLTTTWTPRDYQITFNVYEGGDEQEQVTDPHTGQMMLLPKYPAYSPQNARGWSSPTFPMTGR
jgi:hypothetical protein